MSRSTRDSSSSSRGLRGGISRRQWLAGASAGAAAMLVDPRGLQAQTTSTRPVVFSHTTVITVDAVHEDVALAVDAGKIAAIGPTDEVVKAFAKAEVYDGRGKALLPGLINCHAHLAATLARGFNEDFGFPNSARLAVQPASLLQGDEATLMVTIGALEAIRTGTTTIVENSGGIARHAAALARTGLRCVFAESVRDSENVAGPMSPEGLAKSETPRFSAKLRDEGMQRITELFGKWHGASPGSHQRLPRRRARRDVVARTAAGHPRLRGETRPRLHDSPVAEPCRSRLHGQASRDAAAGLSGEAQLPRAAALRRPLPLRRRGRHRAPRQVGHDRVASGWHGGEPRRHSAHPRLARRRLPNRQRHRQQHQRSLRGHAHRAPHRANPA